MNYSNIFNIIHNYKQYHHQMFLIMKNWAIYKIFNTDNWLSFFNFSIIALYLAFCLFNFSNLCCDNDNWVLNFDNKNWRFLFSSSILLICDLYDSELFVFWFGIFFNFSFNFLFDSDNFFIFCSYLLNFDSISDDTISETLFLF